MTLSEIYNFLSKIGTQDTIKVMDIESGNEWLFPFDSDENGLNIKVGFPSPYFNPESNINLKIDDKEIRANKFIPKKGPFNRSLNVYIFQSLNFKTEEMFYFKLLIPLKSYDYLRVINNQFNLIKIHIQNIGDLLIRNDEFQNHLVIESKNKIEFKNFKAICERILRVLGYLNGKYVRNKQIYLQCKDKSWNSKINFFVRFSNKTVHLEKPISFYKEEYNHRLHDDKKINLDNSFITEKQFEKLIELFYNNEQLFASLIVLFDSSNNSITTRPATRFLVFETVVEELSKIFNPYTIEKEEIKNNTISILSKYSNVIDTKDYSRLKETISSFKTSDKQISDRTRQLFKYLNIELSLEEKIIINKRNDFFHGKIVNEKFSLKDEEKHVKLEDEYFYWSSLIYTLISKLLFKYIEYSGYVINHSELWFDIETKCLSEKAFIKI